MVAVSLDVPSGRARAAELLRSAGASFPALFLPDEAPEEEAPGPLDAWIDPDRLSLPTTLVMTSMVWLIWSRAIRMVSVSVVARLLSLMLDPRWYRLMFY